MKTKKLSSPHGWWWDPSMIVLPGDELLDQHLLFPRRDSVGLRLKNGRYILVENDKVVFELEARPELESVMKRLDEALLQEKFLIDGVRDVVERPNKHPNARRPPRLKILILETAVNLSRKERTSNVSLATLIHRSLASRGEKVSLRHVVATLTDAERQYSAARPEDAYQSALEGKRVRLGPRVLSSQEAAERRRLFVREEAAQRAIDEALDDTAYAAQQMTSNTKK